MLGTAASAPGGRRPPLDGRSDAQPAPSYEMLSGTRLRDTLLQVLARYSATSPGHRGAGRTDRIVRMLQKVRSDSGDDRFWRSAEQLSVK